MLVALVLAGCAGDPPLPDSTTMRVARAAHTATPLPDGRALVIGGQTADDAEARLATTLLFDPRGGRFTPAAPMAEPRYKISDAVVALPDGRLAVAGGYGVEVYADGRFSAAARGTVERQYPAAAPLPDGSVLVTGGYDDRTRVTATVLLVRAG
ncbi:hypothetical protein Ais01nite_05410 [Asanoa ishikariensis]|nr:hypothetical protein Ais01nite_05410 [Asanoa ishikariensis]